MRSPSFHTFPVFTFVTVLSLFSLLPLTLSLFDACNNGVFISYQFQSGREIPPIVFQSNPSNQAYRFHSTLTVLNNGPDDLKNWQVFVGFKHGEILVSASNAVLVQGTSLPANVSTGALLSGSPVTDLKSAIQTAGNVDQMQVQVDLVGTQFGVREPDVPMPESIRLVNDGYSCLSLSTQENETSICCNPTSNNQDTKGEEKFPPLQNGDLSIMFDVISTYESNYWAKVTISNQNPLSRLDNWNLQWDWMEGEFINSVRGAYPKAINIGECVFGRQGMFYKNFDFSKVLSCETSPTITDLPVWKTNDTNLGLIPFCCRNGTILSPVMDPNQSKSAFEMQVYKMPPNLSPTHLIPPRNWKINSTVGPDYQCGQPVQVTPTNFPDPSGLLSKTSAIASWQVVCNITQSLESKKPKCCVSFSSFFSESVIPCNTCACGCDSNSICSTTEAPLLLPAEALLVPFDNRTELARAFADIKRRDIPNQLPCGDNCGISINWHLRSDYGGGWTARITVFNWGETEIRDWFAAVELEKGMAGFEKVYSMDGKALANDTLFLKGLPGLNYLNSERNGSNPRRNSPVPGTQQSVISFTKKQTPAIRVSGRDGFPSKVYFNGEECSLPAMLPSNSHNIRSSTFILITSLISLLIFRVV